MSVVLTTVGYTSHFNGDGRTDRASLQRATRLALTETDAQIVRPYNRYTSGGSGTDAQIVRPYKGYSSDSSDRSDKKDLAEVRRIVAVGRRGTVPNDRWIDECGR